MLLKKNIPIKYIFGKIKYEILFVAIYGFAIEIIYKNFNITEISIPMTVPTVLGTIISLLLAFRSNQAYDRWWEARQIWGAVVNDSRTLARQVMFLIDDPYNPDQIDGFKNRIIKRQIAWCYALAHGLRKEDPMPAIEKYVSAEESESLQDYDNKHVGLIQLHARDYNNALKQGWVNPYQQIEMDATLTRLVDSMGKCERIKNTVFPSTYSLYIHLALHFFILLLPFGLVELFGFLMVPVLIVITGCFFLIEKMAIHLQDPFENKPTDTPMLTISRNIERDLKQMMRDKQMPVMVPQPEQFYVL
ncbi:bestrophin family protein [Dyadobacter psychrophilus]|uniref:Putative membrane protein n=1 Tax=Dyadobacter psychrophilus TaxID=651661 RepID=A0A1T5CKY6_9BACT|nr:bestrophin family ion channel [Dyadobacter psychrophilus]SKB60175.1 putative membrane protein [Dyadobacter psychrophilus]